MSSFFILVVEFAVGFAVHLAGVFNVFFFGLIVDRAVKFDIGFQIVVDFVKVFAFQLFGNLFKVVVNRRGIVVIDNCFGINAVHHFKVNDVAQLHGAGDQFVAPFGNGFQRHRVFAETANHHGFSGFDAFGYGNFAFARQKLDGAHFLQVHPHRVVRAHQVFRVQIADGVIVFQHVVFRFVFRLAAFVVKIFGFVSRDDADFHIGNCSHNVFYLVGGFFFGRKRLIKLFNCDVAQLFAFGNQLLQSAAE